MKSLLVEFDYTENQDFGHANTAKKVFFVSKMQDHDRVHEIIS